MHAPQIRVEKHNQLSAARCQSGGERAALAGTFNPDHLGACLGRDLRGVVGGGGVDDEHLVEEIARFAENGGDDRAHCGRLVVRRQDHRDRARAAGGT